MPRIVPLKFRNAGKHYHFDALDFELNVGDRVVVETDRGRALATVVHPPQECCGETDNSELKAVLRMATAEDMAMEQTNSSREEEAYQFCQERILKRNMEMKLVRAEYLFDGSKIIFYFTADGRVDFRELVKDLAHHFHTRIEMRQIGVRDEAKLIGGIGICGRELCCCTFLTEFSPVSVRMAKEQGLALNPTKISGQCGRLLCCLSYEFETYCNMKKCLPKCGRKVQLDNTQGEVINQDIIGQKVVVRLESGQTVQVTADQIEQVKNPSTRESAAAETTKSGQQTPGGEKKSSRPPRNKPAKAAAAQNAPAPEGTGESKAAAETEPNKTGRKRSRRRRPRRK
ncbi:MAG: stage 0 sporulation family protein [Desulfuromonadaceae bacterium]